MRVSHNVRRGADDQPSAGPQTIATPAEQSYQEPADVVRHYQKEVDRLNRKFDQANRAAINLCALLMNSPRYRRPIQGNMQPVMVRMVPEQALTPMIEALRASFAGDAGEPEIEGAPV